MNKKGSQEKYKTLLYDFADTVSRNEESANEFFREEGVDIEKYVAQGMKQIDAVLKNDKQIKKTENKTTARKSNLYFKRAVLAAEIASKLYNEPTFGHVKFQKLVYLGEQLCELASENHYSKQAAGPFDRKFMHSIDKEFKRQKWFEVKLEKQGNYPKYNYTPLENLNKYKQYYTKNFKLFDKKIQWLISTFKKSKTGEVELIATLYYCWKEIIESNEVFSEDVLITKFYKWSKEKSKYSRTEVKRGITWMNENELIPVIS